MMEGWCASTKIMLNVQIGQAKEGISSFKSTSRERSLTCSRLTWNVAVYAVAAPPWSQGSSGANQLAEFLLRLRDSSPNIVRTFKRDEANLQSVCGTLHPHPSATDFLCFTALSTTGTPRDISSATLSHTFLVKKCMTT